MNISQWWLASWLEVVVLPTSRSAVRIAGLVGVALFLELVGKSRKAGHQEICTSRAVSSINFNKFFFFQKTMNAQWIRDSKSILIFTNQPADGRHM
jgi:hypothetical protein